MLKSPQLLQYWMKKRLQIKQQANQMLQEQSITLQGKTLRFKWYYYGDRPNGGYSMVFGLHGGGNTRTQRNDQQFNNHLRLYKKQLPDGIVWFVPRSCQEAFDMWWKSYMPQFLNIIIKRFVIMGTVNPNKVFITGYSAGGDGIYHLAPMMADQLAGAAMMAGHPNRVQLFNVRNIAFSIQVGGQDAAWNRNNEARKYLKEMSELGAKYGGFSSKYCHIFEQHGHWLKKEDAKIFDSFLKQTRNPYPTFIIFKQHPRIKKQYFYFLEVDPQTHKELLIVQKVGNVFLIQSQAMRVTIWINHLFVDYSQQVKVWHNGTLTVCKKPERKMESIIKSIDTRLDPCYVFEDFLISMPTGGRVPLETMQKQQQNILPNQPQTETQTNINQIAKESP